jgi:hypothetical protein
VEKKYRSGGDYGGSTLPMDGGFGSPGRGGMGPIRDSRTLTWDRNPKPDRSDPKYFPVNSLPRQPRPPVPNTTLSPPPPRDDWTMGGGGRVVDGYNYGGGHRDLYASGLRGGGGDMPPPMHALPSYQPPPPVVTEQPQRTAGMVKEPTHFRQGEQGKL